MMTITGADNAPKERTSAVPHDVGRHLNSSGRLLTQSYRGLSEEKGAGFGPACAPPEHCDFSHKDASEMFKLNLIGEAKLMLLAGVLASSHLVMPVGAQSPAATGQPVAATATKHYQPNRFPKRADKYYGLIWGVDSLAVKWAESGEIIRFSYRVLDADKAKTLNDKKAE